MGLFSFLLTKKGQIDKILTCFMALLDIFKGKKQRKAEEKLKRPSKGAFQQAKKKDEEKPKEARVEKGELKKAKSELPSRVLLAPHITEKSTLSAEKGIYAFRVAPSASKVMIRQAIADLYGYKPRKITIANMPAKTRSVRGKKGVKPGYRKAMIYLKEGDKIELA